MYPRTNQLRTDDYPSRVNPRPKTKMMRQKFKSPGGRGKFKRRSQKKERNRKCCVLIWRSLAEPQSLPSTRPYHADSVTDLGDFLWLSAGFSKSPPFLTIPTCRTITKIRITPDTGASFIKQPTPGPAGPNSTNAPSRLPITGPKKAIAHEQIQIVQKQANKITGYNNPRTKIEKQWQHISIQGLKPALTIGIEPPQNSSSTTAVAK